MRAPLVVGVVVLAAGIAVGAQRPIPPGGGPLVLCLALVGASGVLVRPGADHRRHLPWVLLLLAGALLGTVTRTGTDGSCIARLPPDLPLKLDAELVERTGDRVRLAVSRVDVAGTPLPCAGVLPGRFDGPVPTAGTVVAEGRWWRPPGSRTMNPVGLLLLDRLEPGTPDAEPASRKGRAATALLDRARGAARARVEALFGRRAPLAVSLLLAQRDGLDREVRDRFARAGLSHLLAISGLHVAVVAGVLLLLAGALRIGKGKAAAAAGAGTAGYVAFLGAPYSAARAALQILLVLGARAAQRPARTEALIAAAALVLLAADPAALFSVGFQLSFAGVAGILALRRPLMERLSAVSRWRPRGRRVGRWLADGLATSIAATAATAPIVAWHFGRVAPIGIVANLVAIPLLSVTVPAMVLALAVGVVSLPAGRFLAGAGVALLDALDATATVAARAPGAAVTVPASVAALLTIALAAGFLASRRLGRSRGWVRGTVWAGVAVAVLMVAPLRPATDRVEVHMIDVGQGDAIALRSPGGRWVLVDAGIATDRFDAGARLVVPYLARNGVQRLEGVVITHPDADHMGGAGAVLRAFRPRWVLDPGMAAAKTGYLALLRTAAEAGTPWIGARRGVELDVDGMVMHVLFPAGPVASDDANDGSVVVRVAYGEFEVLLTGDAPASVERALVRRYGERLDVDVLKVAHHGSSTSTTPELLAVATPTVALVSAGRGNRYGHPHRSVIRRIRAAGAAIARSDRHGSVVVYGRRGGGVRVESERGVVVWP